MDPTRWTIWLAMAAYVAAIALRLRLEGSGTGRGLWTLACLLSWAHVLLALALHHQWSHAAAYAHTAQETAKRVGVEWGGGIYFNYLFLAIWSADAIWWWWYPHSYRTRPTGISIFVHAYLAFIAFNATVVFGPSAVRYAGLAAIVALGFIAVRTRSRR